MDARKPHCVILTGPTGVGKSKLALELAERFPLEIISADSRQLFRGLDIGTAKPAPQDLAAVPHHQIDTLAPGQSYSAGEYSRDTLPLITAIAERGRLPLVVGGSGFYIETLLHPLFESKQQAASGRVELESRYRELDNSALYAEFSRIDPQAAAGIDVNDRRKILRYLEIFSLEGEPPTVVFQNTPSTSELSYTLFVLHDERERLYRQINERVERMIEQGLVTEVQQLLVAGSQPQDNAMLSVGYREIVSHLQGETTLAEAIVAIKKNTRNYAKRQLTWFRRWPEAIWILPEQRDTVIDKISQMGLPS